MKIKLYIWRMRRGMTQRELARASGVAEQTINRIESKGIIPYPSTLKRLAEALDVSLEDLLVENDEKEQRLARVS